MRELFSILKNRITEKKPTVIVCAVSSEGSSPVKSGAFMLVGNEGRIYGTVGGGNLENTAIKTGVEFLDSDESRIIDYDLGGDLGMVCGGETKLLFHNIPLNEKSFNLCLKAIENENKNKEYTLILPFEKGAMDISDTVIKGNKIGITEIQGNKYYYENFCNDGRVYVFGSGHVAEKCVPLLSWLGFRCVVIDDREDLLQSEGFKSAELIINTDYKELDNIPKIQEKDYILVMTRGHKWDIDAEIFALKTPACYIGVIGSRPKGKYVREYLESKGYSAEQLDRIITPVGIDIKGDTPAEIAVSIAAQLIEKRAEKTKLKKI